MVDIAIRDEKFDDWPQLLALIRHAFAYMEARIDPPSSLRLLDEQTIAEKAQAETLLLAYEEGRLIGCVFLRDLGETMYLGKLAVDPAAQQSGIGRALVDHALSHCRSRAKRRIMLESRVELSEVHDFFRRQGFRQTGTTAHTGYDRPTAIVMEIEL
ncbi:MAG: GNAT family N-acetyltransferase [Sneathiella sp.]|uniref:GNAT family N-acetyltransferase n=1 Tax=Sneathiella sp. TaxID=1964365 RepID=UPI000C58E212|nr:GNAT family N-acetyltransferase [Sneathiella sp.]MAL78543.1 GNAT family N-acetyltransferase [Sneathiella sp.]